MITLSNPFTPLSWYNRGKRILANAGIIGIIALATSATAGPREQALQIHNRVAGVPPTEDVLLQMTQLIEEQIEGTNPDGIAEATDIAMSNEAFYSVTLKNMATPWTNREQTVFAPLNDYVATVIGMVRDNKDFRTLLYGNILYTFNGVSSAYSNSSNDHYLEAESRRLAMGNPAVLVERQQSQVTGLPAEAISGVITSRAAARAFFIDGTNRAMFRFTLMNHLCRDLEQVHDVTRIPDYIRQDVSRSPGGDSRVFLNNCMGCHNGMDPMAQAYAYYDFEYPTDTPDAGAIHYNTGNDVHKGETKETRVEFKYLQNSSTFKQGFVTPNNEWRNYWRKGINMHLGWDLSLPGNGIGASSMNQELAHSRAFAACQVEKVFENVCLRTPASDDDLVELENFTDNFAASGYQLKQVFRDTANYCKGD